MNFYRFEELKSDLLTPNLSTAEGSVIEGKYIYFCSVFKETGTGSEPHYHPNELLIFPLKGKINAVVGKDNRIVEPGTFIHVPAYALHSMKATEDGPLTYLYIKDQTWSVVGVAADEETPEKALSVKEVNDLYKNGKIEDRKNTGVNNTSKSAAIIEGLYNSYYPILDKLDAKANSAQRTIRIEGERMAFEFIELPKGCENLQYTSGHEKFIYLLTGYLNVVINGNKKTMEMGDVVHIEKGAAVKISSETDELVRYVAAESQPFLEERIDQK